MMICALCVGCALTEGLEALPQIDSSTARIPITEGIEKYFADRGITGPKPICSKTHGAWLNLASGDADIIFLIAPSESELQAFVDAGRDIEMKVFGYDALVFMGNASNPVDDLTSQDIRDIYRGDVDNWCNVGNADVYAEIVPYIRNEESGSQRLFKSLVWDAQGEEMPDFADSAFKEGDVKGASAHKVKYEDDMSGVTYSVMEDRYSIGYNILSYVDHEFLGKQSVSEVVTTGKVNLRDEPSLDGEVIGTVTKGTHLVYSAWRSTDDRGVEWYRVEYEGGTAWISSRYSKLKVDDNALKLFSVDGAAPTTENIRSGAYPFVTTSFVAIRADEAADSPARRLYDWIGSDESREIIEANSTLSVDFTDSVVIRTAPTDVERQEVLDVIERLGTGTLERRDLFGFTREELDFIRQGCYAHAGRGYLAGRYADYFKRFEWYDPRYIFDEEAEGNMSEALRADLELIDDYLRLLDRALASAS